MSLILFRVVTSPYFSPGGEFPDHDPKPKPPVAPPVVTPQAVLPAPAQGRVVLYDHEIASYDDSIQPTGTIHWGNTGGLIPLPVPHVEMKKLHHDLHLVIEGPAGSDVTTCVQNAMFVGMLAGVVAGFATAGEGAVAVGEQAALATLLQCLGSEFAARFENHGQWITWDT